MGKTVGKWLTINCFYAVTRTATSNITFKIQPLFLLANNIDPLKACV